MSLALYETSGLAVVGNPVMGKTYYLQRLMLTAQNRNFVCSKAILVPPLPSVFASPSVSSLFFGGNINPQGKILIAGDWNPSGDWALAPSQALLDWYALQFTASGSALLSVGNETLSVNGDASTGLAPPYPAWNVRVLDEG